MKINKKTITWLLITLVLSISSIALASNSTINNKYDDIAFEISNLNKSNDNLSLILQTSRNEIEFIELPFLQYDDNSHEETNSYQLNKNGFLLDFKLNKKDFQSLHLQIPPVMIHRAIKPETVTFELTQSQNVEKVLKLDNKNWIKFDKIKIKDVDDQKQFLVGYTSIDVLNIIPRKPTLIIDDIVIKGDTLNIFDKEGNFNRGVFLFEIPNDKDPTILTSAKIVIENVLEKVNKNWSIEIPIK
ncbi:MAG: hypothetical protein HPY74_16205 [Firmicutes bacterium]|nr:hypothetical protein [Elusimicrobiota bacterium]NSW92186.1 hypothetical protein [Bacillota bacterium]